MPHRYRFPIAITSNNTDIHVIECTFKDDGSGHRQGELTNGNSNQESMAITGVGRSIGAYFVQSIG